MDAPSLLRISGLVAHERQLSFADLSALAAADQIPDVRALGAKRAGQAVRLNAVLNLVGAGDDAAWLTLHAAADNFHASIPLAPVRARAVIIYREGECPLSAQTGGPFRFFIPDHAACHTAEVDECANVKFIDWLELSRERGHDNRPTEDAAHAELHRQQQAASQQ